MNEEKMVLMTPLQCAYMIERKNTAENMGVPCHVYMEFQTKKDIEEKSLKAAWAELFKIHPMMRARCDDCGILYIGDFKQIQCYKAYKEWDIGEFERKNIRQKISHQILDVENEVACQLHVIKSQDKICRIGFELDLVICDVHSFQVILKDLADMYMKIRDGKGIFYQSGEEIEVKNIICQDEVLKAKRYWQERMGNDYIEFPFKVQKNIQELSQYNYISFQSEIENKEYDSIVKLAVKQGVTVEVYLLIVLCYVVLQETGKKRILVNYLLSERNQRNLNIVGDFTKSIIFKCESETDMCFKKFFDSMYEIYRKDWSHCCLDGLSIQTIIKKSTNEKYPVPFVFSPSLNMPIVTAEFTSNIGELVYIISQTPGGWLDAQVYRKDDGLFFTWVILKEVLDEVEIANIFNTYIKYILKLNDIGNWRKK